VRREKRRYMEKIAHTSEGIMRPCLGKNDAMIETIKEEA